MYNQIDKNKRRTLFLLFMFVIVVVSLTYLFSYVWTDGNPYASLMIGIFAFIISLISGLFSYYGGASLVLAMSRAVDVTDNINYRELNDRIETLSIKAGIPKPRIHVLPDQALNAFATGRDPQHAHVALTEGIMRAMEWPELEAVIAHELGHIKNYDIRLMLVVSVLAGVITYLADFFIRGMFFSSRDQEDNKSGNIIVLVVAIAFAILAPIISVVIQMAISRRREFLADMTSVEITRHPKSMINALKMLQKDNRPVESATEGTAHMYIDFPLRNAGGFLRKLFTTHPPIEDRIAALQKLV